MLEEILKDQTSQTAGQNRPLYDPNSNYGELHKTQEAATRDWAGLGKDGQSQYGNKFEKFLQSMSLPDLKSDEFAAGKNYYLMSSEVIKEFKTLLFQAI